MSPTQPITPVLSIIVPVYNEEKHLKSVVQYLMEAPCPIPREWIFVDDCSKDRSVEILKELQSEYSFQLIQQTQNQGKGAAILRGLSLTSGHWILIQDADFEYDPHDIPQLLKPLLAGKADVVYGSRFKETVQVPRTYHYFSNAFFTILSNLLSGLYLTDMETCYKLFQADLLRSMNLTSKRFGFEIEVTAYLAKTQARIYELPISYFPRSRLQGKKINWKDGIAALFHLVYFNLLVSPKQAFPKKSIWNQPTS